MWTIFKVFIEFVTILLLFYALFFCFFFFFCCKVCEILITYQALNPQPLN